MRAMVTGLLCLFGFACAAPAQAQAAPFDCARRCGAGGEAAYPHLVIGTVESVADAVQGAALFRAMRRAGRWAALPADEARFPREIQPVLIRLPGGHAYTVLISRQEADAAPLVAGDFVRYAPHRGINEKPPAQAEALAYWNVIGCIAVLCRAGDGACERGYQAGLYRVADGAALAPDGRRDLPGAARIDLGSMRPLPRAPHSGSQPLHPN